MKQNLLYYIRQKNWFMAKIYTQVTIGFYLSKLRRKIDRLYLRIWPLILGIWILTCLTWGVLVFKHDYDLLHNYANLDAPFSDIYTKWNTYGAPGQDPPK